MPEYPHMQKSLDTITHISADLAHSAQCSFLLGTWRSALVRCGGHVVTFSWLVTCAAASGSMIRAWQCTTSTTRLRNRSGTTAFRRVSPSALEMARRHSGDRVCMGQRLVSFVGLTLATVAV